MHVDSSAVARFWRRVEKTETCWLWRGPVNYKGYGTAYVSWDCTASKSILTGAHRLSWVIHNGQIPDGMHVLHKCDVPSCVNPAHLFTGTNADNMADKTTKGRARQKLTGADIPIIKQRLERDSLRTIAKDYGVCSRAIWNIKHGKAWGHVQ